MRQLFSLKSLALPFGILLLINMIALDVFIALSNQPTTAAKTSISQDNPISSPSELTPTAVSQNTPITIAPAVTQVTSVLSGSGEFFIPLGTGSSTANEWTDVPGVQAYVDSKQYKNIKKITFEASIVLPNGLQNVYVRLFNKTDKHPVWFSEISMPSSTTSQLIISNHITLDPGNILYQVQMKTQLQAPANLVQSRIHILTY